MTRLYSAVPAASTLLQLHAVAGALLAAAGKICHHNRAIRVASAKEILYNERLSEFYHGTPVARKVSLEVGK
jgi:hypothetical protein